MAYSFQSWTINQVLTSTQQNQVEVNIRDHVHGSGGVGDAHYTMTVAGSSTFNGPLRVNNIFSVNTNAIVTDASNNVGYSVDLRGNNNSIYRSIDYGPNFEILFSKVNTITESYILSNVYHNGANWIRSTSGEALQQQYSAGTWRIYTSPSTTGGTIIAAFSLQLLVDINGVTVANSLTATNMNVSSTLVVAGTNLLTANLAPNSYINIGRTYYRANDTALEPYGYIMMMQSNTNILTSLGSGTMVDLRISIQTFFNSTSRCLRGTYVWSIPAGTTAVTSSTGTLPTFYVMSATDKIGHFAFDTMGSGTSLTMTYEEDRALRAKTGSGGVITLYADGGTPDKFSNIYVKIRGYWV